MSGADQSLSLPGPVSGPVVSSSQRQLAASFAEATSNVYEHLTPLQFKTEQKCWEPEFWHSKFTDLIKDGEVTAAIGEFVK